LKLLIDIGHPAHVHYFRNTAYELQKKGHNVLFCLRAKDVAEDLLKIYNLDYIKIGYSRKGFYGKIKGIFIFTVLLIKIIRQFKPDLIVSSLSPYAAFASFLTHVPLIGFADTDSAIRLFKITYPFISVFLTPHCFTYFLGNKHIKFNGYLELSYLNKKYFKPDFRILHELNLSENDRFILLRFVSWDAHHDTGKKGLTYSYKKRLISELLKISKVFISSESELPEEFKPYQIKISPEKIHDVLAYASLFIGEGATMASECAMLGTPAIYINIMSSGTLEEQEKYGLVYGFRKPEGIIEKAKELFQINHLKREFQMRRIKMVQDKIDLTKFIVWFIEQYPESYKTMRKDPDFQYNFK